MGTLGQRFCLGTITCSSRAVPPVDRQWFSSWVASQPQTDPNKHLTLGFLY